MIRRSRLILALIAVAMVLATAAGAWLPGEMGGGPGPELVVTEARASRVLLRHLVAPGERFTLAYLHSVSQTRVSGVFEVVAGGDLVVRETSFGTFGPGLPELGPGDRYEIRDGLIRQFGLNQRLPEISLFVHPYTEHRLEVGGRTLDLSGTLPGGTLVRIAVEATR
ncbi:MAG: DUF1850 domain-containing protein [Candidatus Rokubacteria bacterium]|nr:DUF1850 domain-containing protein [Candidatus Rokubacteria bacterium]